MDTLEEVRQILKELALSQKELHALQKENEKEYEKRQFKIDAQFAKTDAQLAKTDAQLAKTIKKLDAIGVQLGDMGHSNGEHAESFFYDALANKKTLGGVKYDAISKNFKRRRNRTEDEYDIFLENGSSIGLIEVKYKVQKAHIEKLLTTKRDTFKLIFPEYEKYSLYMGIAGFSFEPDTENYAADNGLVVLKQKGDHLEVNSSQMKAF